ncbi:MAG: diguanylate cyclase domain-containing protein [Desulfosudaceae bacterium]
MNRFRLSTVRDWKNRLQKKIFRSTIATKMTLAYLPLSLIIILLSAYTLTSLVALGDISREIVSNDMTVIEAADRLTDNLLAQESYGRRYLIMKSEEMQALFAKRNAEFETTLQGLLNIRNLETEAEVQRLVSLHDQFNETYLGLFALEAADDLERAARERNDQIQQLVDEQLMVLKEVSVATREGLADKMRLTSMFSTKALYITAALSGLGVCIGIGAALVITRSVSRSINQLKLATAKFSERQFDFIPDVKERDEFGTLARSFIAMAQRLARLEVMDLDANPLTRLPGGTALENVLQQRIDSRRLIAFCLIDIDNFKAFNDRYGYARGNQVIKRTAKIIEAAIADHGTEETFLGHIGGDDFAVIAHSERYAGICESVIEMFDREVVQFYDKEDRERGYITARTRQGEAWEFPLMTISIAVVTNQDQLDMSTIRIGEIAAEIKEHAKTITGSLYLVDRRKISDE